MASLRRPYRKLLARDGGLGIWRVDGHRVRDTLDVDFTQRRALLHPALCARGRDLARSRGARHGRVGASGGAAARRTNAMRAAWTYLTRLATGNRAPIRAAARARRSTIRCTGGASATPRPRGWLVRGAQVRGVPRAQLHPRRPPDALPVHPAGRDLDRRRGRPRRAARQSCTTRRSRSRTCSAA
jgi:hypothetical protein